MRLLGLLVIAVLAACAGGAGQSFAAPGTTTPTTPTTPAPPSGSNPGSGIPMLDEILDQLAGGSGSAEGNGGAGAPGAPTNQMIVVTAPRATDTTASLTAFERGTDGSWKPVIGPTKAFLGSLGMGEPKDNVHRTPQGTFALDQAFGREANPGTKMPYLKVDQQDWWDSDMKSPTYNTHVRQPQSPGGDSENLYNSGPVYDYAVNIAHNPERTPGKASAMFLHVTNDQPTMGCVAIERELMKQILVWLDPAKNPKITIGVNQGAPTGEAPGATPQTAPGATPPTSEIPGGDALTGLLTQLVGVVPSLFGLGVPAGR
ncbi:L,D-transpeptidase family protein [Gordonia sp. zg691]|uniref:L,D-transpeptidase family protein n=1 Tax=Gordonia jinghuaiqii TaxID=2758710 RepID=A0A7D7LTK0_9ACTN|nr:L,D-transpeptidase family protein [Gordonia jinghuaiqii]MBD0862037.1 L,D-transpeptidase family protein [Gordonia jinghuaiqii]MCR5978737.1 L,D-transpeptidase family protein [Gordonia jinghuaiqii]QMT03045.1 L,D-transpeptidase family protein [Gordonia jinghuaiqii]